MKAAARFERSLIDGAESQVSLMEVGMNARYLLLLCLPLAVVVTSGCSRNESSPNSLGRGSMVNPFAPLATASDTTPHVPPPHPTPHPAIPGVQFFGSDTVSAGQTSTTHWIVGNNSHSIFTLEWTLTDDAGWGSLPQHGTVTMLPRSTQRLDVAVAVPGSTVVHANALLMTVTQRSGPDASAGGVILVSSNPDSLLTNSKATRAASR